tara:strand:- start:7674 stop:11978 length:4305 start_codon:yes stop_codon:yes gene_type:complete
MAIEKKIFAGGGMDMDTNERFMAKTDYKKAVNCRVTKSDEGNDGIVENTRSNFLHSNANIQAGDTVIGAYEDKSTQSVIYFVHAADGNHGIYRRPAKANIETIIQDPILNFDVNHLITGINVVGSDEDIFPEGLLYWTDDFNPPRKINIHKAINGLYSSVIDEQTLDAVKYPPRKHPVCSSFKTDDSIKSNQLKEKAWQFTYRYIYDDLEKSAWSPISPNYIDESFSAYHNEFGVVSYKNNCIPIYFKSGHHTADRIQIAARNTNGIDDFILIADIDKKLVNEMIPVSIPSTFTGASSLTLESTLSDNSTYKFLFYNDSVYSTVDSIDSSKLYDDIPHLAKAQEIVDGNRMVYGNIETGQTVNEDIDISLTPDHKESSDISNNITEYNINSDFQVKTVWDEPGSNLLHLTERRCRFQLEVRFLIPEPDPTCTSIYHIEVEDFIFGGTVIEDDDTWSSYRNGQYPHLSVLNINYGSSLFPAGSSAANIASGIVNDMNLANASTFLYNNIQSSAPSGAYTGFTFLHGTGTWSSYTSGGNQYVRFRVSTDKTPEKLQWSTAGSPDIRSIRTGGSNVSDGIYGYNSNWTPLGQKARVTQWLDYGSSSLANKVQVFAGQNIPQHHVSANAVSYFTHGTISGSYAYSLYVSKDIMGSNFSGTLIKLETQCMIISNSDASVITNIAIFADNVLKQEVICNSINFKSVYSSFKTGAKHRFGLVYYDRANRSSSVKLGKVSDVYIPRVAEIVPSYINSSGVNSQTYSGEWHIDWEINHSPPDWATHYQWVYGGNTLTNNFIQFVTDGIYDGAHALTDSGQIDDTGKPITSGSYKESILVDITNIRKYQEGESGSVVKYNFKEGDVLRFVLDNVDAPCNSTTNTEKVTPYEFRIVGIAGENGLPSIIRSDSGYAPAPTNEFDSKDFLVLSRESSLVTLSSSANPPPVVDIVTPIAIFENYTLEIYSPLKNTENDTVIYNEFGHVGDIITINGEKIHKRVQGAYQNQIIGVQPTTGRFTDGDVYFKLRNSKSDKIITPVESLHFSDKFKSDYWDKGRPNALLEDFKRSRKHSTCLYSEAYIPNTNINGLSSFFPDVSFQEFERDYNSIQKLHSRDNKLIIFQEDKVSQSLVNRNVLYNIDGSGNVATSDSVLSQAVPYLGNYGINKNPESFAAYGSAMYFVDMKRGAVVRLSNDGFTPISEYKMKNFFTDNFEEIVQHKGAGRHRVLGVYDTKFNEYVISSEGVWTYMLIPDLDGNMISIKDKQIIAPYTIGFCESSNRWNSFYSYIPEMMCSKGTGFVSFNEGNIYRHNISGTYINAQGELKSYNTYNNFYGVDYDSELWVVSNEAPSNNKVYQSFSQESDDKWGVTFTSPNGQETALLAEDFDTRENIHYSDIMNDVNSDGGLIEGDRMRDVTLLAKLKIFSNKLTKVFGVNFNFAPSQRSNK